VSFGPQQNQQPEQEEPNAKEQFRGLANAIAISGPTLDDFFTIVLTEVMPLMANVCPSETNLKLETKTPDSSSKTCSETV